jgi:P27 family predicted phage terminase small subunit
LAEEVTMKGRKPTPIATLRTRGTFRPDRHAHRGIEPVPLCDGPLNPPEHLSESQKDCWRFVVQNAPDGVLKRIDQGLLTAYVVACDMHRVAAVQQEKMDAGSEWPLLVRSPRDGTLTMSPYVRILSRTTDTILRLGAELGLSPISRTRLAVPETSPALADPQSPWMQLRLLQGGVTGESGEDPQPA